MAVVETRCPRCGSTIDPASLACAKCGLDLHSLSEAKTVIESLPQKLDSELVQRLARSLAGEYEIHGILGRGGMAMVLKARELGLDRDVAIKVLPPHAAVIDGMVERFTLEARTSARLKHPNIIPIYRIGEASDTVFFVMDYVDGASVADMLDTHERLGYGDTACILHHVCEALEFAHSNGVVHRDVKPSNIMIGRGGWVIVTDFGIAKALDSSASLTSAGMLIGTPHFMSPEQCAGAAATPLSDQYALGILAYRMIGGRLPFEGTSLPHLVSQHTGEIPTPLLALAPEVPIHAAEAVERAMAKKPEDRFASVKEFLAAFTSDSTPDPEARTRLARLALESRPVNPIVRVRALPSGRRPGESLPSFLYRRVTDQLTLGRVLSVLVLLAAAGSMALWFPDTPDENPAPRVTHPPDGALELDGLPPGAVVLIDGRDASQFPDTGPMSIAAGTHEVRVIAGSDTVTRRVVVPPDSTVSVRWPEGGEPTSRASTTGPATHPACDLSPAGARSLVGTTGAVVRLENCVPTLELWVNGRPRETPVIPADQPVRVLITAEGYRALSIDTTLAPGDVLVVDAGLERM